MRRQAPRESYCGMKRSIWCPFYLDGAGHNPRPYSQPSCLRKSASPGPSALVSAQALPAAPTPPGPRAPPPPATRAASPPAPSRAAEFPRPPWVPRGRWAPRARPFSRASCELIQCRHIKPRGVGSGSTEIWPLTGFWPGRMYMGHGRSYQRNYHGQKPLVKLSLVQILVPPPPGREALLPIAGKKSALLPIEARNGSSFLWHF